MQAPADLIVKAFQKSGVHADSLSPCVVSAIMKVSRSLPARQSTVLDSHQPFCWGCVRSPAEIRVSVPTIGQRAARRCVQVGSALFAPLTERGRHAPYIGQISITDYLYQILGTARQERTLF
jgi:hypothetical protein